VIFPGYSGSSTNKTDRHDIAEILLKVALNTINQLNQPYFHHIPHPTIFHLLFTEQNVLWSSRLHRPLSPLTASYISHNMLYQVYVNCQQQRFTLMAVNWIASYLEMKFSFYH